MVTVSVDRNLIAPQLNATQYETTIPEDQAIGTNVLTVFATDTDRLVSDVRLSQMLLRMGTMSDVRFWCYKLMLKIITVV